MSEFTLPIKPKCPFMGVGCGCIEGQCMMWIAEHTILHYNTRTENHWTTQVGEPVEITIPGQCGIVRIINYIRYKDL